MFNFDSTNIAVIITISSLVTIIVERNSNNSYFVTGYEYDCYLDPSNFTARKQYFGDDSPLYLCVDGTPNYEASRLTKSEKAVLEKTVLDYRNDFAKTNKVQNLFAATWNELVASYARQKTLRCLSDDTDDHVLQLDFFAPLQFHPASSGYRHLGYASEIVTRNYQVPMTDYNNNVWDFRKYCIDEMGVMLQTSPGQLKRHGMTRYFGCGIFVYADEKDHLYYCHDLCLYTDIPLTYRGRHGYNLEVKKCNDDCKCLSCDKIPREITKNLIYGCSTDYPYLCEAKNVPARAPLQDDPEWLSSQFNRSKKHYQLG